MKGTGEVLEEVVSRDTHNAINKVGHKSKLSQSIKGLWHRFQSKLARCFQFETLKVGTIFSRVGVWSYRLPGRVINCNCRGYKRSWEIYHYTEVLEIRQCWIQTAKLFLSLVIGLGRNTATRACVILRCLRWQSYRDGCTCCS